ncbi:MAG: hypothetical protein FGM33_02190 [Candidatus Kapabacteria bacterium]|nr:hypothetical protein [Candidatus Kapabacteria bacterium]
MWYLSVLLLSLLASAPALAQFQSLTTSPYDGQVDVSTSASIRVRAPSPIIASSLSSSKTRVSNGLGRSEPTVLVVRSSTASSLERHDWVKRSIVGELKQLDEFTVEWTPQRLLPKTSYRCIIQGIVVEGKGGPQEMAPIDLEFTTAEDVPRLQASTMDSGNVVLCSSVVWLRFTGAIGMDVSAYDLLDIDQQSADGTWQPVTSVQVQRVSPSLLAAMPPAGWTPNSALRINVKLSRLTGVSTDDRRLESMVRGAARLTVRPVSTTGRSVSETILDAAERNASVVTHQTGVALSMPSYADERWRFVRWECESISDIHGNTSSSIQASIDCSALRASIEVRAVYEFLDTIDVLIRTDTLGTVLVTDQDGRELAMVTDSATIRADTTVSRLFLSARPLTGATFSSWTSSISGCNSITAPSITVPVSALTVSSNGSGGTAQSSPNAGQVGTSLQVFINPQFQKLTPLVGDRYRLRARVMNSQPEEGHAIEDHVVFTTPNEYEETKRTTRTVCVLAEDCWEIVGYHDAATGPPVWFDKGRRDLCVDAELLDPENTLVIFGRRIPIDVRIERVLLATDNDEDVILDKSPHSETRIDVDKLAIINGVETWLPMPTVICTKDGISTQRVGLRCGDKIRMVVRAATQRGEEWLWWSARNRYAVPREAETLRNARVYTLKVDESIANFDATACDGRPLGHKEVAIRAAFRKRFVVESIALRVRIRQGDERWRYTYVERWYDPLLYYDSDTDEPKGGRQVEYIARRGTPIKIKFSRPVDVNSIYAGGIVAESFANILHTDAQAKGLDFTTTSSELGNAVILSSTGQYLDIVEFAVYQPGSKPILQALHAGMIDLLCTTGIRSIDNEPLQAMQLFAIRRMELPGFGIRVTDATFKFDGDTDYFPWEDHGEMYHALFGMNTSPFGPIVNADGFVRYPDCGQQRKSDGHCTRECGDEGDVFPFGDREIWAQTAWMDWGDLAFARIGSWDEDCQDEDRCLVNSLRTILADLKVRSDRYKGDTLDPSEEDAIYDVVSLASSLISALLPVSQQDDLIGEVTFLESSGNLWGMSTPTAPRIFLSEENADYRLRGQWFVSRAVVR